jgi:hypothetical protein
MSWHSLPCLPGYSGAAAYGALPPYAAALHSRAGLTAPPYDPVRIARALGVPVQIAPTYEGNRGLLVPLRDGSYRIIARADETGGAQRFTVAHELVELGLQIGCPALVERSYHDAGAGRAKERYCEAGAAEILLPLEDVRQVLAGGEGGIAALPALARLFGASLHATLRRLVDASCVPCAGLIACPGPRLAPAPARRVVPAGAYVGVGEAFAPAPPRLLREMPATFAVAADPLAGSPTAANSSAGSAIIAGAAAPAALCVRAAFGGGGLVAAVPAGASISPQSLLAACHRERAGLRGVEPFALGRLRGRFRVEALCPGHGPDRHVYALLHPA